MLGKRVILSTRDSSLMDLLTEYIEIFYNWQRKHVSLGYLSPVAFTQLYQIVLTIKMKP